MSGSTALHRKAPPVPLRWLHKHALIGPKDLDYGCGHGPWYDMDGWDPVHKKNHVFEHLYDTIVNCYVLNTLTMKEAEEVFTEIIELLIPGGVAYIIVRRDLPWEGKQGRGCWQRYVSYDCLPILRETSTYCIYEYRKDTNEPMD